MRTCVTGVLVPPVLLKYVEKCAIYIPADTLVLARSSYKDYFVRHRHATMQSLAWCLHRFPALETLVCVGSLNNDAIVYHELQCQLGPLIHWGLVDTNSDVGCAGMCKYR